MSLYSKKQTEQGSLTSWTRQREGVVRTPEKIKPARQTHILKMADGVSYQDTETNRASTAHSLPKDGRERDLSVYGIILSERGALTS